METILFPRSRSFFYHYNKPASAKVGCPVMTVHVAGRCHQATHLICNVPAHTRQRNTQPHLVMAGTCRQLAIEDNLITIS